VLPHVARADDGRFALSAQGDAQYYEVNSDSIPASPNNSASSLVAHADLTNSAGTAFASDPYYGSTVQNLPGTANGVPGGFGFPGVGFPFTRLPGYVQARCPTEPSAQDNQGYGQVNAKCSDSSAEAHGTQGAPGSIPAPNQQETADAITKVANGVATADASGTASGFVSGPLEVGNSTAHAVITEALGAAPKIESTTFGRFSVGGQQFGFDKNGFTYLGQSMSQQEALDNANKALTAAGLQIEVAPVQTGTDAATGQTTYTIGGLKVTQVVPAASPLTVRFILGRASVSGVNRSFGALAVPNAGSASGTRTLGSVAAAQHTAPAAVTPVSVGPPRADTAAAPAAAAAPAEVATVAAPPTVPVEVATVADHAAPTKPIRIMAVAQKRDDRSGKPFYVLPAVASLLLLAGQQLFSGRGLRALMQR
jgi:hypothetical protein